MYVHPCLPTPVTAEEGLIDTYIADESPVIVAFVADGRIAPRSGLASKHFIDTGAGVIDADYRGQVKVLLFNHGEGEYRVKEGERVAQLVLERVGYSSNIPRAML